jgi:hypothetical protein
MSNFIEEIGNDTLYTKKGTLRKRKPKQNRNYFNQDTEDAILRYLKTEDIKEKNKIYNEYIDYSFYKLAENIINQPSFGFAYLDTETKEDKKQELVWFMLEKLHLYRQAKGKAYSYFGTIIKRYMILDNKKNYQKAKNKVEVENFEQAEEDNLSLINDETSNDNELLRDNFFNVYVNYLESNLEKLFPKQKDIKIADAVMELFRKKDDIDVFNKKALYIYIREIIDVETAQITKIIKRLKNIYIELYNKYYRNGHI